MVSLMRTMVIAFPGSTTRYLHYAIHIIWFAALNFREREAKSKAGSKSISNQDRE